MATPCWLDTHSCKPLKQIIYAVFKWWTYTYPISLSLKWVHTKAFYSVWFRLSLLFFCPPWLYWHQLSVWYTILSTRLESLLQQHFAVSCNRDMWYKFYYYRGSETSGALWHGYITSLGIKVASGHQTLQLGIQCGGRVTWGSPIRHPHNHPYHLFLPRIKLKYTWRCCMGRLCKRKALAQNLRNFWKTFRWECLLKRPPLCHTIRCLFKTLKSVFASSELQINGPVLLCKTIFRHGNCFMLPFATDGKDGYGLKLDDEICLIYSS